MSNPTGKSCKTCDHWQEYDGSYDEYGSCRAEPPRMNIIAYMVLTSFGTNHSPALMANASMFPVTHENEYCDRWTD